MLREDGYEVDIATDGVGAAERLAQSAPPDVLVTELRTPPPGGARLVRLARATHPGLAIIVVTSHPHLAVSLEQDLDPPALVLTKPLVYDELQALLARLAPALPGSASRVHHP